MATTVKRIDASNAIADQVFEVKRPTRVNVIFREWQYAHGYAAHPRGKGHWKMRIENFDSTRTEFVEYGNFPYSEAIKCAAEYAVRNYSDGSDSVFVYLLP